MHTHRYAADAADAEPHVWRVAHAAHVALRATGRDQAIVISGDSGAGKTESTKLALQYLTAVSGGGASAALAQHLLGSNPVLEAFGNAKTVRNDNSSRFGKYIQVHFDPAGAISGGTIHQVSAAPSTSLSHQPLSPDPRAPSCAPAVSIYAWLPPGKSTGLAGACSHAQPGCLTRRASPAEHRKAAPLTY